MAGSISKKLDSAVVGIAGLGGLGSSVAAALVRTGIGTVIIADFDTVDKSNLNRQQYFIDQIGKSKVEATMENLRRINPDVKLEGHWQKLTAENIPQIFNRSDVIAECFDNAEQKQMLVEAVLTQMSNVIVVSVSGLAGYGKSNAIRTSRISKRLILIGDGRSGTDSEPLLTAGRVGIAASHQANAVIEVLVDEIKQ